MDNTKALIECLKPVKSSMFSKAGYSDDYWTFVLVFKSTGEIRAYPNVAPEIAEDALNSGSLGTWWNANVKNNREWESEIIGTDEQPKPQDKTSDAALGTLDEYIKLVEPGWDGEKIVAGISEVGDFPVNLDTSGVIKGDVIVQEQSTPISDTEGFFSQEYDAQKSTLQPLPPQGELLGAWTAPESAAEALDLLAERDGEIKAIIAQNVQTGQQALTVKVDSQDSRIKASETLDRLVAKKNKTVEALDPFRKVLYEAYNETGAKVKSGVDPLENGIRHVKQQILSWDQAEERKRQDALRKAREEADAESRRQQQAESQRVTLAEVGERIERGDDAGAQTLFDAPIEAPKPYVAPQIIPPAAPKVEGQSTATTWKVDRDAVESDSTGNAYLQSITLLLRAVKDGSYPVEQAAPILSWDFGKADKLAGAMMSAFNVPGLTAVPKTTMRVGGRGKKK